MNLNQLKIFYMAAKHKNLSAAADELFITQPAITKGIQRIQEYYEIKFVNHIGKKLVLTDAGEALYEIAEKIFEMESQADESIRDFQQRKKGHIRIHSSETFGAYYLHNIIIPFSKNNPMIRILANILPTEQVVENAASLHNDLGFISYPLKHKKLKITEIMSDRYVIVAPPEHRLAKKKYIYAADLKGEYMVMHEKESATYRVMDHFARENNLDTFIPLELSNNESIKRVVEQGIGLGLMSLHVVSREVDSGQLIAIPFTDPAMKRKFYMVHHKDKYISEPLRNFIDLIQQWASDYQTANP